MKKIKHICDYCGKEHLTRVADLKKYKRHFCSQRCHHDFRSKRMPREEHSRFDPRMTDKERQKRYHVRNLVGSAIRWGKLKRGSCDICKKPNAQAHHDNYDKPFRIRWLCAWHHTLLHAPAERHATPMCPGIGV